MVVEREGKRERERVCVGMCGNERKNYRMRLIHEVCGACETK